MKKQTDCPKPEHKHDDNHVHGPNCGHATMEHDGHVDYLVDGHMHHPGERGCACHGQAR